MLEIVYLLVVAYQFTTGLYEDTLIAQGGCDSIIVTALNVNPTHQIYDTLELCFGDSILIGGGYQSITWCLL